MKGSAFFSLILLLSISIWMTGCKGDPTSPYATDEDAIKALVAGSAWFNSDDHFEGGADSSNVTSAPITPFAWGRERTQPIQRTITIDQVGDSAHVTIVGKMIGVLHIWAVPADTDTVMNLQKPVEVDYSRTAIFKKTGEDSGEYRGWVLVKISGVDVVSTPTITVMVDSVHLQGTSVDTTLTDPSALFEVENALMFTEGDSIDVTVYTNDSSALVYLHPFRLGGRTKFQNNGDGSYSGIWIIPSADIHRVAFDVIQWETLYDDSYDHDSSIWVYPYKVQ